MLMQRFVSWRFEQHIKEGNYQRDFEAIFDQQNLKVKTFTGERILKNLKEVSMIFPYTQDAMRHFIFFRGLLITKK